MVTSRSAAKNSKGASQQQQQQEERGIKLGVDVAYDDVYGASRGEDEEEYVTELPPSDEEEEPAMSSDDDDDDEEEDAGIGGASHPSTLQQQPKDDEHEVFQSNSIAKREGEYQKRRHARDITAVTEAKTYKQLMMERQQQDQQGAVMVVQQDNTAGTTTTVEPTTETPSIMTSAPDEAGQKRRRRRWDDSKNDANSIVPTSSIIAEREEATLVSDTESTSQQQQQQQQPPAEQKKRKRWDETPVITQHSSLDATPLVVSGVPNKTSRWAETPLLTTAATLSDQDGKPKRSRWDSTPLIVQPQQAEALAFLTATPSIKPTGFSMISEEQQQLDKEAQAQALGISLAASSNLIETPDGLPFIKQEDLQYFGKLLRDETKQLSKEEEKEHKIAALLLKIKSGTPPQRKTAMRQITDKAPTFGAKALFDQILPILMSPTLEDQERHLLVKVVDRILYKLDDLVRPHVSQILAVIEPLLVEEDYYARVEGREVISNLAKAAGLPTMIATMRPDLDNPEEYVRNTTARAFAVVATALGVSQLLPFLKAVCMSKKSWQARHTGIKIVQQIAILQGCAVLPHLKDLVEIVAHGLVDEQRKIRTVTALTLAAMAESSFPYGIESFDSVIRPLWKGALDHHSKLLAAFLKAIGFIIPLMEENYASHYTKLVMPILIREFHSPDEEMKKIVLRVIQQCVATAGVEPEYIRSAILPDFFRNFWVRRMALDRRNHKQVVETTVELSNKVGASDIITRIVDDLKDDSEPYRRMVMETMQKVLENLGGGDIDERLEERLIDGMLYAFQEQAVDAADSDSTAFSNSNKDGQVMLDGFGAVVNALGVRCKPYLKQIAGTIKWRLNNKSASVRMQASDLIGRIAVVMKACGEDALMGHLGIVLYEYLGEEYPDVLGSILGALKSIVNVIGMTKMTPPIRDLLPRLTPILRNRHEKVQENCIDLVGRIADRGAEFVSAKEWMRICFELLEMLKANKKSVRRASTSTFGYIAKAIGPQDVLHTLLNNLKVQDRQMRVCTTVAIAIVAETCGPFTVLPALMNEYSVPELNIQNGVLKAMSFMFEYIGDMAKDYIYAVTPLLEDALMDRDPVHRQTACATVKHLSLGVAGLGCEDALLHLLNYVWPNMLEESPHVVQAFFDAVGGMMVALGPIIVLQYALQGLFHPARKVRESTWKVFNTLYIFAADALVMGYPQMEDEGENTYSRSTLHMFI